MFYIYKPLLAGIPVSEFSDYVPVLPKRSVFPTIASVPIAFDAVSCDLSGVLTEWTRRALVMYV